MFCCRAPLTVFTAVVLSCVLLAFFWRSGVRIFWVASCVLSVGVLAFFGVLAFLLACFCCLWGVSLVAFRVLAFWRFGVLALGSFVFFVFFVFLYLLLGFFGGVLSAAFGVWCSGVLVSCFCFWGVLGVCFRRSGVLAFSHVFWGSVPGGLSPSGRSCYTQASEGDELRFTVWFNCDVLWAKEDNNVLDGPVRPSSID